MGVSRVPIIWGTLGTHFFKKNQNQSTLVKRHKSRAKRMRFGMGTWLIHTCCPAEFGRSRSNGKSELRNLRGKFDPLASRLSRSL